MTSHESSLLQARGGAHAHAHSAYKHRHAHGHAHDHLHHHYPHDAVSGPRPGDDKPDTDQSPDLKKRANAPAIDEKSTDGKTPTATSLVTEVIQTVSLVQIVDTLGSPLSTLTQFAVPNTVVINKDTGKTISASNPDPTPAPAAPGSGPDLSKGVSSSSTISSQAKATPFPSISASSPASLSPSAPSSSPSTAPPPASSPASSPAPSPAPSPSPSLGIGHHNGTNIHHSSSHSSAANSMFYAESVNATATSTTLSSTTPTTHSSTSLTTTKTTTSESSSFEPTSFTEAATSTISSFEPQATDGGFGGGFGGGATPSTIDSMQPTPSSSSNSTVSALSPQQKQVIGGVLGGVAGAAFFLVLVLVALRWKRRQNNAAIVAGQPTSESRGLPPASGAPSGVPNGGDGNGGGSAMAEKYSAAALTAAFTGLAPKRSSASVNSSETGERGFYRVSGRKLPSVLQVGGDGYSDPRSSFMSGTSDYYRGSQAFDPFGGPGTRLQLGAPMRPDSGVPIVRSGPARPVVAEENPFADPPTSPPGDVLAPPSARPRGSPRRGSRFQEGI